MHAYVQVYTHTYKLFLKAGFKSLICKTFPKVWITNYFVIENNYTQILHYTN